MALTCRPKRGSDLFYIWRIYILPRKQISGVRKGMQKEGMGERSGGSYTALVGQQLYYF